MLLYQPAGCQLKLIAQMHCAVIRRCGGGFVVAAVLATLVACPWTPM